MKNSSDPQLSKPKLYVFIGPEKTGTTTIFDLLPFARVPAQKEMFLLSRRRAQGAEIARINAQLKLQESAFIVEPTYFLSSFARETLSGLANRFDLHVIHTRRDPVERTISHYLHHKAKGRASSPAEAVAAYPEIVEASHYESHSNLWRAAVPSFSVIDVTDRADLATALEKLGIAPRTKSGEALRSNMRLAPRNATLARLASAFWQSMIAIGLNRLIPPSLKNVLKGRIYYGGRPVEANEEERECLKHMLLNIA